MNKVLWWGVLVLALAVGIALAARATEAVYGL